MDHSSVVARFRQLDADRHSLVGVALDLNIGIGFAIADGQVSVSTLDPAALVRQLDAEFSPRWVWWDRTTARMLADNDTEIDRCWDVLVVQRLLYGGWRWSIPLTWAALNGLDANDIPELGQLGLLDDPVAEGPNATSPLGADGHIRPEWPDGRWREDTERLARWASLALNAATLQTALLQQRPDPEKAIRSAHAESAAELLCIEMEVHGLPIDETKASEILASILGPRPGNAIDEDAQRRNRDELVLSRLDPAQEVNLRSSAEVKSMLRRLGVEVADTRAWRLERVRNEHPVVDALLEWRKAERMATTYGYRWLGEHVREGRLRGSWSSSDGSAGRMTATAGLHNLPSDLRPAIVAESAHVFVRADLGQIEPRVLAAVSNDPAFVRATQHDDLYLPVAQELSVPREIAKVAVLGAMYGATTGESAHALRGLESTYPIAMGFLAEAARSGRTKTDVLTVGGRLIQMSGGADTEGDIDASRAAAASRGRYARNAVIQGAAAELFKIWAVLVRSRVRPFDANVVLCLHDELLVHVPEQFGREVAEIVASSVGDAAHYWSPATDVRFLADVSIIERWSDAKAEG